MAALISAAPSAGGPVRSNTEPLISSVFEPLTVTAMPTDV